MHSIKAPSAYSGYNKVYHSDTEIKTLKAVNVDLCKELSKLQLENESHKDTKSEIKILHEKVHSLHRNTSKRLAGEIMPSLKCLSGSMTRKRN